MISNFNANNLRATKVWIKNNIDSKDLEELGMPKQDVNLSKGKELARKPIIRLEKIREKREHWYVERDRRD